MKRLQRAVVIASLIQEMKERGSWCGETHIQKAMFFLQDLLEVPTPYDFILYKHGPFSFDLRDEITDFRAIGLLKLQSMPSPYGPSLTVTPIARNLAKRYPQTSKRFRDQIQFVAESLGDKGVAQLERLATALYVTLRFKSFPPKDRAPRITKLKPHVDPAEATAAVAEVDRIVTACRELASVSQT